MFCRISIYCLDRQSQKTEMAGKGFNLFLCAILLQIICTLGSNCNWHYFQHYEQKGCTAVLGQNGCPVRFQCEKLSREDRRTCVHNGKIYKRRNPIQDTGPCNECSCEVDKYGSAFIECAAVDCPDWEPKNKSCYMGYKPGACCPIEMCPAENKDTHKTCSYNGKEYKIGEYIRTSELCKTCICTEDWTGEDGPGCSSVDCLTGIFAKNIRSGCLTIYSDKRCCLSEMYCDGIYGATPAYIGEGTKDDYCYYQGTYYDRGSTAYMKNDKHQCITCRCTTPPDFTCVRKFCPGKPRPDCKTVYGHCCPNYECP